MALGCHVGYRRLLRASRTVAIGRAVGTDRLLFPQASRSIASCRPLEVLRFWFGDAWGSDAMSQKIQSSKTPYYFGFNMAENRKNTPEEQKALDDECRELFGDAIHACGQGNFDEETAWKTDDGLYARMILTDQIPRNAFRGTPNAFAFDGKAIEYAREIYQRDLYKTYLQGHFGFLLTPGQHSEELKDHEMNMALLKYAEDKWGEDSVAGKESCLDHKQVIDRFGRFPHRNEALGRKSTLAEEAWLADVDNLPSWAKRS